MISLQNTITKLLESNLIELENYSDINSIGDDTLIILKPLNEIIVNTSSIRSRAKRMAYKFKSSDSVSELIDGDLPELYLFLLMGFLFNSMENGHGINFLTTIKEKRIPMSVAVLDRFNKSAYSGMFTWSHITDYFNVHLPTGKFVNYSNIFSDFSDYSVKTSFQKNNILFLYEECLPKIFTGAKNSDELEKLMRISKGFIIST